MTLRTCLFRASDLVLSASRCEILNRIEYWVPFHGDFLKISPLFSIAVRRICKNRIQNTGDRIKDKKGGDQEIRIKHKNIEGQKSASICG